LGIPTANIPLEGLSVGGNDDIESGIYYGWAGLSPSHAIEQSPYNAESKYKLIKEKIYENMKSVLLKDRKTDSTTEKQGAVFPMVMSIGWNPYYKNTVRSIEVHIMHDFKTDFYDSHMNVIILGFIRPEYDYVSKDSLIDDIKTDIDVAGESLSRPAYAKYRSEPFLLDFDGKSDIAS